MSLDEQRVLWISDPWVAAIVIVTAIGLIVWCHLRLGRADAGRAMAPVRVGSRAPARRPGVTSPGLDPSCGLARGRERRDARRRRLA